MSRYRPLVLSILASCTLGTNPCDDVGSDTTGVLPWWGVALVVLGAVALVAGLVGLLLRADRNRPWD